MIDDASDISEIKCGCGNIVPEDMIEKANAGKMLKLKRKATIDSLNIQPIIDLCFRCKERRTKKDLITFDKCNTQYCIYCLKTMMETTKEPLKCKCKEEMDANALKSANILAFSKYESTLSELAKNLI